MVTILWSHLSSILRGSLKYRLFQLNILEERRKHLDEHHEQKYREADHSQQQYEDLLPFNEDFHIDTNPSAGIGGHIPTGNGGETYSAPQSVTEQTNLEEMTDYDLYRKRSNSDSMFFVHQKKNSKNQNSYESFMDQLYYS